MLIINILQKEIDNIKFTIKKYFAKFRVEINCENKIKIMRWIHGNRDYIGDEDVYTSYEY